MLPKSLLLILFFVVYSFSLRFASRRLKFIDTTYLTSIKVSLVQGATLYILSFVSYMGYFGFLVAIALIKYYYKVDIRKAIYAWLIAAGISTLLALAILLPIVIYRVFVLGIYS